jgi:hypothetical protein
MGTPSGNDWVDWLLARRSAHAWEGELGAGSEMLKDDQKARLSDGSLSETMTGNDWDDSWMGTQLEHSWLAKLKAHGLEDGWGVE